MCRIPLLLKLPPCSHSLKELDARPTPGYQKGYMSAQVEIMSNWQCPRKLSTGKQNNYIPEVSSIVILTNCKMSRVIDQV